MPVFRARVVNQIGVGAAEILDGHLSLEEPLALEYKAA